jgi:hypothetical protein
MTLLELQQRNGFTKLKEEPVDIMLVIACFYDFAQI